jgi:hypothetical protein
MYPLLSATGGASIGIMPSSAICFCVAGRATAALKSACRRSMIGAGARDFDGVAAPRHPPDKRDDLTPPLARPQHSENGIVAYNL